MAQELERALEALRRADAAGNTEDAKRLAEVVRRVQASYTTPEPRSDLLTGIANRALGLVQGGVQAFDEAGKFMQRQIPLGGFDLDTGEYVSGRDIGEGRAPTDFGVVAEGIQQTREQAVPYAPAVTWEGLKAERFPVSDVVRFIVDTGVVSTPDMVAAVTNLPGYVVARAGELAEQRAAADGREQVTGQDMLAALGTAAASGTLERVGGRAVLQAIPGGRSLLGRVGSAAGREAGTEALQEVIEDVGVTAGTETGFDPARIPDTAAAAALAGGGFGGAVRTGIETARLPGVVRRAVQANQARADVRSSPDQMASDVRVADLYEKRVQAIQEFDPEAKLETDVVFKDLGDTLERELKDAAKELQRAGDIDRAGVGVITDAIRAAKRHNRTLAEGGEDFALFETEIDRLRDLGLDAESTETLINTVRDLNTAIGSSLKKDRTGPIEAAARGVVAGVGAGGVGAAVGATLGGPMGAGLGATLAHTAGKSVARRTARAADRALGLDQPEVLRRSASRRAAAEAMNMSVGDTVAQMTALRRGAQARERLVVPQTAPEGELSPVDRVLREQGVDRQGGWLRATIDQVNSALPAAQRVTQEDVFRGIEEMRDLGAITQSDFEQLTGDRSGRITDERVFYGIQDYVLSRAGGAKRPAQGRTPATEGGLQGIRNVPSYMQTMRNVQAATETAMAAATAPEERAAVTAVANARTQQAKSEIADRLASEFPQMAPFIEEFVRPLTLFGPARDPMRRPVVERGRGGRPIRSAPIPPGSTEAILKAYPKVINGKLAPSNYPRGGNADVAQAANLYKARNRIAKPAWTPVKAAPEDYLRAVADAHEAAVHAPTDPAVVRSYQALAEEVKAQYRAMSPDLKVEPWTETQGEPYRNAGEMLDDLRKGHLYFFRTDNGFGEGEIDRLHPMAQPTEFVDTEGNPLLVNDLFRIVHDYFGHGQNGFQFGPNGEYNAFHEHARMFSDEAVPALAAETLAQNAWVNRGPHLRRPDGSIPVSGDPDYLPPAERPFSPQKAYLVDPALLAADPNGASQEASVPRRDLSQLPYTHGIEIRRDPTRASDVVATGRAGKRVTVGDIGRYFDEQQPSVIRPAPEDLARVTDDLQAEVEWQLTHPVTGENWYSDDVGEAFRLASEVVPEFAQSEDFRVLSTVAAAILSGGQKPGKNMENTILQMEHFANTGAFSEVNPENGKLWSGKQGQNQKKMFEGLNGLLDHFGSVEALNDWLFSEHPGRVVNQIRQEVAGFASPSKGVKQNAPTLGMRMFGPKFTNFALNLQGIDTETTKDLWFTRGWNRQLGTMTAPGPVDQSTGLVDQPRSPRERDQQDAVMDDLAGRLSKPQSAIQAIMWFFEQQLFDAMGARSNPEGMSDGARRLLEKRGIDGRSAEAPAFSRRPGQRVDQGEAGAVAQGSRPEGVRPSETVVQIYPDFQTAQREYGLRGGAQAGFRVHVIPSTKEAILIQKPPRPSELGPQQTAGRAVLTSAMDPEGREVAAQYVAGARSPDGTMRGLELADVQDVARQITRLVQIAQIADDPMAHGRFTPGPGGTPGILEVSPSAPDFEGTFRHETGHAVESLKDGLTALLKRMADTPGAEQRVEEMLVEMRAVSSRLRPTLWGTDSELRKSYPAYAKNLNVVHEYRNRFEELLADAVRGYMQDPEGFKNEAPQTARFIRDTVNPSVIGDVISFASMAGLAIPAVAAAALSGGEDEPEA